jgi:hypothetical protein
MLAPDSQTIELREAVLSARSAYASAAYADKEIAHKRLMKAIAKFNDMRDYKIHALGLDNV